MTAGVVADRYRNVGEFIGLLNSRVGRHEDARRRDGVGAAPHLTVTRGSRHIHRPVTSGAQIAAAAIFDRFKSPALDVFRRRLDGLDVRRPCHDRFDEEFVIQSCVLKIAFPLGHPLLKTPVRLNSKFTHNTAPSSSELTELTRFYSLRSGQSRRRKRPRRVDTSSSLA